MFLIRVRDGLVGNFDMFLSEDEALRRAAERGRHADDDRAAQRDRGE